MLDKLRKMLDSLEKDCEKAQKGNIVAGTRFRKGLQEIKAEAQRVRLESFDWKKKD